MNKIALHAVTLLGLAFFSLPVAHSADNFTLEPSHTSVIFGVSHLGFSYTYGRFNEVAGSYALDKENPAASQFQFSINASSIDTNDAKRDEHLRGPDFFNVKQFPAITFQSTEVATQQNEAGETVYEVTGDLTIHGVTRKVILPLRLLKEGQGMQGDTRTGFLCEKHIMRTEFGMTNMVPAIGDEVAVTISFEGVKQ
ncbi:YceI family protein [Bythopirellula polymerisocia]|uniref:Lipid/polyisoprenoid-binding YceI-like domain-containing protein n=1 Tax=Bythopirellula polymerisocia TaxID=2528003 RepID=A0A5C6D3K6_9BACT|nr:YceI family protein [Bythopirellula polymerisocia]TWU30237.1 hypothetical protein Pla144_10230 [Bythopirellula polymerisocia]